MDSYPAIKTKLTATERVILEQQDKNNAELVCALKDRIEQLEAENKRLKLKAGELTVDSDTGKLVKPWSKGE